MISAVLRASSAGFDPKSFIEKFNIDPDAVFKEGFNACLADSVNKDDFIEQLKEAVDNWHEVFEGLTKRAIKTQIDISVTVGTADQFTCSIALPVEITRALSEQGVQIVFSAYPASDETEDS